METEVFQGVDSLNERVKAWLETQAGWHIVCSLCGLPLSPDTHVLSRLHDDRLSCDHKIPDTIRSV